MIFSTYSSSLSETPWTATIAQVHREISLTVPATSANLLKPEVLSAITNRHMIPGIFVIPPHLPEESNLLDGENTAFF
jgi:hypothetical protein